MKKIDIGDLVAYKWEGPTGRTIELGIYLGIDYVCNHTYNHMVYWTKEDRIGYEPASDIKYFRKIFLTQLGNTDSK